MVVTDKHPLYYAGESLLKAAEGLDGAKWLTGAAEYLMRYPEIMARIFWAVPGCFELIEEFINEGYGDNLDDGRKDYLYRAIALLEQFEESGCG